METIDFDSHGTRCEAWHLPASTDVLSTADGRPVVVMAHGFGATRDSGLLPFAERFAAAGLDVVLFDYRGFGTSDVPPGRPRQDVDHRRHREDYHAAVAHARGLAGVDPERVVLWGSSYSGGHVVAVAAADTRVAGLVSQGAAMDGVRALRCVQQVSGTGKGASLTVAGLRDLARRRTPPGAVDGPRRRATGLRGGDLEPQRRSGVRRSSGRRSSTRCAPAGSCGSP